MSVCAVCNKWFRERGQEFIRPCDISSDSWDNHSENTMHTQTCRLTDYCSLCPMSVSLSVCLWLVVAVVDRLCLLYAVASMLMGREVGRGTFPLLSPNSGLLENCRKMFCQKCSSKVRNLGLNPLQLWKFRGKIANLSTIISFVANLQHFNPRRLWLIVEWTAAKGVGGYAVSEKRTPTFFPQT